MYYTKGDHSESQGSLKICAIEDFSAIPILDPQDNLGRSENPQKTNITLYMSLFEAKRKEH